MADRGERAVSDYQGVVALMKQAGSPNGFTPVPPWQHQWQFTDPDSELRDMMWSWMVQHTFFYGRRSPYAISVGGDELGIEHMAADVAKELARRRALAVVPDILNSIRGVWRKYAARGVWRTGEKNEGRRRLYLCGKPAPAAEEQEPDSGKGSPDDLPPYIWDTVGTWPEERQREFLAEWTIHAGTRRDSVAELVALARQVCDERDDEWFDRWGVPKRRIARNGHGSEPAAEAQERRARAAGLLPQVRDFVQGIAATVQSRNTEGTDEVVQGSHPILENSPEISEGIPSSGRQALGAPHTHSNALHEDEKSLPNQLPAAAAPGDAAETPETAKLADELIGQLRRMQEAFPHTQFGLQAMDAGESNSRHFARRMLVEAAGNSAIAKETILPALCYHFRCMFAGIDVNALAKLPERSPGTPQGPRGMGLLLEWAKDFGRRPRLYCDLYQRHLEKERQESPSSAERARAAQERVVELALDQRTDETLAAMSLQQRAERMRVAATVLRYEDRNWSRLSEDERHRLVDNAVWQALRAEMAEEKAEEGAGEAPG